ncbi:MAG: 16S rRNA (guanine(527)-N(7))-methyltransferase RsmG, partial [Candidatus Margulisbacteria bacterium]|nr:16S rRNA (guanine(527)-N(7))-methyltransferase RsmG [Candidatus Margulisiibacteriota bacterium]
VKHIEDSLVLSDYIKKHLSSPSALLDMGTGAGFPGLVIALENPQIKTFLIDSTAKKINFVNKIISLYDIKNAIASCDRLENFALKSGNFFDILVARSLARLDILLEYAAPLLKANGHFLAMKSEQLDEELAIADIIKEKLGFMLINTFPYSLALQKRYILHFQRIKEPSIKLPRSVGLASSKPLSGRK